MPENQDQDNPPAIVEQRIRSLAVSYENNPPLRAAVQLLPGIGGALDILFSWKGTTIRQTRILSFLEDAQRRLHDLESRQKIPEVDPDEPLFDFVVQAVDAAGRTRAEGKRKRLVQVFVQQIVTPNSWEEAETALDLVSELDELHVRILGAAAAVRDPRQTDNRLVSVVLTDQGVRIAPGACDLRRELRDAPTEKLRIACSQLVARGLLHDDGIGRIGVQSLELLTLTDSGEWFLGWLTKEPV